eukprot:g87.t1
MRVQFVMVAILAGFVVRAKRDREEGGEESDARTPLRECENTLWHIEWPYKYVDYAHAKYGLADIVQDMLNIDDTPLDMLHSLLDENKKYKDEEEPYYSKLPELGKSDRDSIFVKIFLQKFDSDYTFLHKYMDFVVEQVKPLYPNEEKLLVQRTPNVRFHIPENTNIGTRPSDPSAEVIGLHCDSEFDHPKGEVNIIVPLTDMFRSNSIFFEPHPISALEPKDYTAMTMSKDQFFIGNLNVMKHYNRINRTGKTRVSLDFRVLPMSKYVGDASKRSATGKNKFVAGDYYMYI